MIAQTPLKGNDSSFGATSSRHISPGELEDSTSSSQRFMFIVRWAGGCVFFLKTIHRNGNPFPRNSGAWIEFGHLCLSKEIGWPWHSLHLSRGFNSIPRRTISRAGSITCLKESGNLSELASCSSSSERILLTEFYNSFYFSYIKKRVQRRWKLLWEWLMLESTPKHKAVLFAWNSFSLGILTQLLWILSRNPLSKKTIIKACVPAYYHKH